MANGMTVFSHNGTNYIINDQNIAEEFSESTNYTAGQFVYYQGNLYKFNTNHSAGSWNSSHANMVKVMQLLSGSIEQVNNTLSGSIEEVSNSSIRKRNILQGVDLDTITTCGLYWHGSGHTPCDNIPDRLSSHSAWILMVVTGSGNNDYQCSQWLMEWGTDGKSFFRTPAAYSEGVIVWNKWNEIATDNNIVHQKINELPTANPLVTVMYGYFSGNGSYISSDSYRSYVYQVRHDCLCYFYDTSDYHSLCLFDKTYPASGSFISPRYRHDGSGEFLPTEANPLTLSEDQYIAVTVKSGADKTGLYISDISLGNVLELSSNVLLGAAQLNQIGSAINTKSNIIDYYTNGSQEGIHIYMPAKVGYLQFDFSHTEDAEKNADTWRIAPLYAADDSLIPLYAVTSNGEWECAVKLEGRPDFSGGFQHGDEITTKLVVLVDGNPYNLNNIPALDQMTFTNCKIIEVSDLYDPNDHTTVIAHHAKEYIFAEGRLVINQNIEWVINDTAESCYLAMCTPLKTYTDKVYFDNDLDPKNTVESYGTYNNAKKITQYSDNQGFMCSMEITRYPTGLTGGDCALITDNSGGAYNKMYFVICTSAEITEGLEWLSQTVYEFSIGK